MLRIEVDVRLGEKKNKLVVSWKLEYGKTERAPLVVDRVLQEKQSQGYTAGELFYFSISVKKWKETPEGDAHHAT
jgi:hypothetical protein